MEKVHNSLQHLPSRSPSVLELAGYVLTPRQAAELVLNLHNLRDNNNTNEASEAAMRAGTDAISLAIPSSHLEFYHW